MPIVRQGKISYLQPNWVDSHSVLAGFSTRHGGGSRPPFNSLNLGFHSGDTKTNVEANRAMLARGFGLDPHKLLTVNQVHGTEILVINQANLDLSHFQRVNADAIITNQAGIMAGILVADCYPVLLFDVRRKVSAVIHIGWRGAAAGLLGHAVAAMRDQFDCRAEDLFAAIGPGIGMHKYEVDRPVRDAFRLGAGGWDRIASETRLGHWLLDLRLSCQLQLESAGVLQKRIEVAAECTCCHKEMFYSYRRDNGQTGRQIGFVLML